MYIFDQTETYSIKLHVYHSIPYSDCKITNLLYFHSSRNEINHVDQSYAFSTYLSSFVYQRVNDKSIANKFHRLKTNELEIAYKRTCMKHKIKGRNNEITKTI